DRDHGHGRQDRGLRGNGPALRPDRDGQDGRDRDRTRPERYLAAAAVGVSQQTASREPFALDAEALAHFSRQEKRALARARRAGRTAYAAIPVAVDPRLDLSAAVLAARGPAERFFCLEQPDRDGFALAALGATATLEARGLRRFEELAA